MSEWVKCELDDVVFTCMDCGKKCDVTQGTWPQRDYDGNDMFDADHNTRDRNEFCCYDCAG